MASSGGIDLAVFECGLFDRAPDGAHRDRALYGRSHDDHRAIAAGYDGVAFAHDGLEVSV